MLRRRHRCRERNPARRPAAADHAERSTQCCSDPAGWGRRQGLVRLQARGPGAHSPPPARLSSGGHVSAAPRAPQTPACAPPGTRRHAAAIPPCPHAAAPSSDSPRSRGRPSADAPPGPRAGPGMVGMTAAPAAAAAKDSDWATLSYQAGFGAPPLAPPLVRPRTRLPARPSPAAGQSRRCPAAASGRLRRPPHVLPAATVPGCCCSCAPAGSRAAPSTPRPLPAATVPAPQATRCRARRCRARCPWARTTRASPPTASTRSSSAARHSRRRACRTSAAGSTASALR